MGGYNEERDDWLDWPLTEALPRAAFLRRIKGARVLVD